MEIMLIARLATETLCVNNQNRRSKTYVKTNHMMFEIEPTANVLRKKKIGFKSNRESHRHRYKKGSIIVDKIHHATKMKHNCH